MSTIVIMPGGFHPFHAGHFALYQSAKKAFPGADLYVAATNDMSERPFPFQLKEKLAKLAGVEPGHFVQVKSPFQSKEITQNYNPEQDVLVFVRSEKDRTEQPKPGGTKKDGTPAYFQPWTGKNLQPFSKHAYMAYLPTVEFGPGITSATQIRKAWPTLNDKRKLAMVMSLYPAAQKNPKLAQNVVGMFDQVMGGQQGVAEGSESDAYGNTGEKHECGSCDGTGIDTYDDVCPECGGKGWVRDKESSKKKDMAEHTELAKEFDLIESIVEMIAEHNGVDADVVWADLESLTEDELYVFAVTSDPLMEDWQKANKRDKTDGMSQKAVNAYRRENPGSKLKTAVTTKPGKLKKGGKASKRRKSYCSRSRGQMKMHSISCAKTPDKAICKARRRWNC